MRVLGGGELNHRGTARLNVLRTALLLPDVDWSPSQGVDGRQDLVMLGHLELPGTWMRVVEGRRAELPGVPMRSLAVYSREHARWGGVRGRGFRA